MKIKARGIGPNASINGIKIKPGIHNYALNVKDPITAMQLETYRSMGLVEFKDEISPELLKETELALNSKQISIKKEAGVIKSEIIKAEEEDVRKPRKAAKKARKNDDTHKSEG